MPLAEVAEEQTEAIQQRFHSLQTPRDVATLLDVSLGRLVYHIYQVDAKDRYKCFGIPKRSGGERQITAPITAIKLIQRKLADVLNQVYVPKAPAHGFVLGKSILTNAVMHKGKRYVLNLDIKDFFPAINFGRVRGMFMGVPYSLPPNVATVLAQICCYKTGDHDFLPQGAPTSPIITNMLCAKLDSQLRQVAVRFKSDYTRYADDITFSTSLREFPSELISVVGEILRSNGFCANDKKTRLQTRQFRQEVTGLTVNRFPNVRRSFVRQIRAMIHAWRKYGLEAAEKEFLEKYNRRHRGELRKTPHFFRVLRGKIEFLRMIRGEDDFLFMKFKREYNQLAGVAIEQPALPEVTEPWRSEMKAFGKRVKQIETELEFNTEPFDYAFLPEKYQDIRKTLLHDNKSMQRARKKDDFGDFCRFAFFQLENGIKRIVRSEHYEGLQTTAINHVTLKKNVRTKNIPQTDMIWLIQLCTEQWKDRLKANDWLPEREEYWYHDHDNPCANNYQVLQYTREVRNFGEHREGTGVVDILERLSQQAEELERIDLNQPMEEVKKSSILYKIQTIRQTKRFYVLRNYDAVESALYKFLETVLT
jgi:RNA-directed DNA polymerase